LVVENPISRKTTERIYTWTGRFDKIPYVRSASPGREPPTRWRVYLAEKIVFRDSRVYTPLQRRRRRIESSRNSLCPFLFIKPSRLFFHPPPGRKTEQKHLVVSFLLCTPTSHIIIIIIIIMYYDTRITTEILFIYIFSKWFNNKWVPIGIVFLSLLHCFYQRTM